MPKLVGTETAKTEQNPATLARLISYRCMICAPFPLSASMWTHHQCDRLLAPRSRQCSCSMA
jgi:hypothetical protein